MFIVEPVVVKVGVPVVKVQMPAVPVKVTLELLKSKELVPKKSSIAGAEIENPPVAKLPPEKTIFPLVTVQLLARVVVFEAC